MKVRVLVDLPDLQRNLNPEDRGALRWAGVSMRMLRLSWQYSLLSVLRRTWPDDEWMVSVRAHPGGAPVFETTKQVRLLYIEKAVLVTETAGLAWLGAINHITLLRMAARQQGKVQA